VISPALSAPLNPLSALNLLVSDNLDICSSTSPYISLSSFLGRYTVDVDDDDDNDDDDDDEDIMMMMKVL
jgi:hypothetical protein